MAVGAMKAHEEGISRTKQASISTTVQAQLAPSSPPLVTSEMDMVDRVMLTHPGPTCEEAQKALDAFGYPRGGP